MTIPYLLLLSSREISQIQLESACRDARTALQKKKCGVCQKRMLNIIDEIDAIAVAVHHREDRAVPKGDIRRAVSGCRQCPEELLTLKRLARSARPHGQIPAWAALTPTAPRAAVPPAIRQHQSRKSNRGH